MTNSSPTFELREKMEADLDESFPRMEYRWPGEPQPDYSLRLAIFFLGAVAGALCVAITWGLSALYR
jgi:hypothetical protein